MNNEKLVRQDIHASPRPRLVVGVSGASGAAYALRLLEILREGGAVESHLVVSSAGARTLGEECGVTMEQVRTLADVAYRFEDIGAAIASGSFQTLGMVVIPCSVKSLAGIAACYSDNLLLRAADVTLKERRPLILSFRETPLHAGHIRLMQQVTEMGAVVAPPMPAFYSRPQSVQALVDQHVCRLLDLLKISYPEKYIQRWKGD